MLLSIVSQNLPLLLTVPSSLCRVIYLHPQTGPLPSGVSRGRLPLGGGQRPTVCSHKFLSLSWRWSCLLEHRWLKCHYYDMECTTHNCIECHQDADHAINLNTIRSVSGIVHTILGVIVCCLTESTNSTSCRF